MDTQTGRIHESREAALAAGADLRYLLPLVPSDRQRRTLKVGRNEACPCGSGKKFKKCHLGRPA